MASNDARFKQVSYDSLNARQKEVFNFQKIAATLADCGYNCIKPADDWQGADFLAYRMDGTETLKVQLKSRITIQENLRNKDIWIAFPHKGNWYLIEHDRLLTKVGEATRWLEAAAWKTGHSYHSMSVNPKLLRSLATDKIGPVYGPIIPSEK